MIQSTDSPVVAYARERRFSPATLERWLRLAVEDREALLQLAVRLRLGENHFRDVLDLTEDIAAHQETTLHAVLASEAVTAVLGRGLGRNEMLKQLKDALRRERYPQLAATEAALADLVKELRLPPGVRVTFPENLEGDTVTVTLQAASPDELRARTRALAALIEQSRIDELFRLLGGGW